MLIDYAAGIGRAWIDGALVIDGSFTPEGGFPETRVMTFLNDKGPSEAEQMLGSFTRLRMWKDVTTTGTAPTEAPYVEITGPAATANAHPWKQGADAT